MINPIDIVKTVIEDSRYKDFNPFDLYGGVGNKFDPKSGYIVVLQHPVTTEYSDASYQIEQTLSAIQQINYPTFWFWPNIDAGSDKISKLKTNQNAAMLFYDKEEKIQVRLKVECTVNHEN